MIDQLSALPMHEKTGTSLKFGFKFPDRDSVPVLFVSIGTTHSLTQFYTNHLGKAELP